MRPLALSAALAAIAVVPVVGVDPAHAAPSGGERTTVERGYVIECGGKVGGQRAGVSLYENNVYTNVVAIRIGDQGASREPADIIRGRRVHAAVAVAGLTARVKGTVRGTGRPTPVRESLDDNEMNIVSMGSHRKLRTRLTLSYRGQTTRLTCSNAFRYRLRVTRTPIS